MTEQYEPNGIRFWDNGKPMLLVQDDECGFDGWICYKHPDGQWVSLRKAIEKDILMIETARRG